MVSLEKNWHGVHYLLCGEVEPGDTLLGQAVLGGTEFGENLGYGPARYFGVEQVATLAREISRADLETEMRNRFDPDAMSRLGIYPTPWSEQAIEGLLHEFRRLRDFYVGAAASGLAIVTCEGTQFCLFRRLPERADLFRGRRLPLGALRPLRRRKAAIVEAVSA